MMQGWGDEHRHFTFFAWFGPRSSLTCRYNLTDVPNQWDIIMMAPRTYPMARCKAHARTTHKQVRRMARTRMPDGTTVIQL